LTELKNFNTARKFAITGRKKLSRAVLSFKSKSLKQTDLFSYTFLLQMHIESDKEQCVLPPKGKQRVALFRNKSSKKLNSSP